MCGGAMYQHEDRIITVYFSNPKAMLPVLKRDGQPSLMPWGRRQKQVGNLPLGGWARLESIEKGIWDKYFPKPVKIPVLKFMEKDYQGNSHWFDVMHGQWIQGLLAHDGQEQRVYIVTIVPEQTEAIHDRWPRIINS